MTTPLAAVAVLLLLLAPVPSQAHIKWFCAYDTTVPPLPIEAVITPTFAVIALLFCTAMFAAYAIDRAVNGFAWARRFDAVVFRLAPHVGALVRAATALLFVVLWWFGDTILTPELKTSAAWVPWLQLLIAVSMASAATLGIGGAGIMVLYVYAIVEYGSFHLMDYPVFPALAVYLALARVDDARLAALRLPVLYAGVAITMMWGAIEKFGYPYWTYPLLLDRPELLLGFDVEQFMDIAGFVEFSLAFFMVTGTALLRWSSGLLLAIVAGAVPAFGMVDAIGHLLILACLLVMVIVGHRGIGMPAGLTRAGVLAQAGTLTAGYATTLTAGFALYYASQFLAGR